MTTGKTIALTKRTFVGKVMSLLFNMLSRLVITFLPRSKRFSNIIPHTHTHAHTHTHKSLRNEKIGLSQHKQKAGVFIQISSVMK